MSARLGRQFEALVAHAEFDAVILSHFDIRPRVGIALQKHGRGPAGLGAQLLLLDDDGAHVNFLRRCHAGRGLAWGGRVYRSSTRRRRSSGSLSRPPDCEVS